MELFKGYVETKDKKCLEKFKGRTDFKTYEQVKHLPEFAGILADNVILIDVDDQAQSEILMNIVEDLQLDCRVYQTSRGRHFLFKNNGIRSCGTAKKLACGLTADIKVGAKNSYSILKFKDKERFIEWDVEDEKDYQELPKWLVPVSSKLDFFNMEVGEGRNTALYTYILNLTNAGFTRDESRQTLKLINKYVFKEPLSEDEIETITRDEAFPNDTFYEDGKFMHNKFAEFLKNNNHIKRINGTLHVYRDGVYVDGARDIENQMVYYIPTMKAQQRVEVLKYLDIICLSNINVADARFIAFENGVFDIVNRELLPFSPDLVITNKIPWNYNPNAKSELLDKTLDKISCHDKNIRAILEESIGYSFYRRNELSKSFILTGEGANGKSTFLDLVRNVLGQKNVSALSLDEFGERFSISYMVGKLANIGDDIADDLLQGKELANFKKIVSGNLIKAEVKHKVNSDEDNVKPTVKLFFSTNSMPRAKSKGFGALQRRLVMIPFNARFSKQDPDYDPFITWKLKEQEVMEYAILLGLNGLTRVLATNDFTQSEAVEKELQEYEENNNPILLFFKIIEPDEIENNPTQGVFQKYYEFCSQNGFYPMSNIEFSRQIKKHYGYDIVTRSIKGKKYRVFIKGGN